KLENKERITQKEKLTGKVCAEQYEGQLATNRLDRYYVYVDYLTYLDICSSESSLPLIHPLTSLENPSIGITKNGNVLTIPQASTLEAAISLGKDSMRSPASTKAPAEGGMKCKFEEHNRRDYQ